MAPTLKNNLNMKRKYAFNTNLFCDSGTMWKEVFCPSNGEDTMKTSTKQLSRIYERETASENGKSTQNQTNWEKNRYDVQFYSINILTRRNKIHFIPRLQGFQYYHQFIARRNSVKKDLNYLYSTSAECWHKALMFKYFDWNELLIFLS